MLAKWSIEKLLQFWTVMTVMALLIMAIMSNYANQLFESTQQVFSAQLLPLENSSQKLHSVVSELSNRQKQILTSESINQLQQYADRGVLEQRFLQNWLRLSRIPLGDDSNQQQAQQLFDHYQYFLQLDTELSELKLAALKADNKRSRLTNQLNSAFESVSNRLKQIEARLNTQSDPTIWKALKTSQLTVEQLSTLSFKVFTLTTDSQLRSVKAKQLTPLLSTLTKASEQLSQALPNTAKIDLAALPDLLTGSQGLIALQQQRLLNQAALTETELAAINVMRVMMAELNGLAVIVHERSYQMVADNVKAANQTRWQILLLGLLLIISMLTFAHLLFSSISQPILTLRQAMAALSAGKFETRMPAVSTQNEVSLLATDFNRFAEATEQLIIDHEQAKVAQQLSADQIRTLFNAVPEAILTLDNFGNIRDSNPAAETVLGGNKDQLLASHLSSFIDEVKAEQTMLELATQLPAQNEAVGRRLDGELLFLQFSLNPVSSRNNQVWVCVISDITARKQVDYQLRKTSQELDVIFENAMVGIALVRNREFVRINQKFEQLFEHQRQDLVGTSTVTIYPNERAFRFFGDQAYQILSQGGTYEAHIEMRRGRGQLFWCAISGKALNSDDLREGSIWLFEDVTKQREAEERLVKLASSDVLTGLPNRHVFTDRVEHAIHRAQRDSGRLAVFFLDLDHFKHINDSLGHRAGDALLCEVAKRIRACLREGDTVARLGGDEFTVLLEDIRSAEYVGKVAEKVLKAMAQPYEIDRTRINVSPSIGISLYPADGRDVDVLIRNADAAMYYAKKQGRNNFQFYSADMNAESTQRLVMETALRAAVDAQEFSLRYQPQVDLQTGQMVGTEVLLRWHSADWGEVSPSKFIPILEETGLIADVGEWVLSEACQTYVDWQDQLPEDFRMAVNLSGRQFKDGRVLNHVKKLLKDYPISVRNLELEITESILMEDTILATTVLEQLTEMGITIAIDDFGTGYSSLSYLKQFPLDVLKIDSSFIRDINHDHDDKAIVEAILALSRSLGLSVVAEGVENQEQLSFLREQGCHMAQGYLFSQPVDKAQFGQLINRQWDVGS